MSAADKRTVEIIDKAISNFRGDTKTLSNAIGYLMIGRKFGWRAMYLIHDRRSIKSYEMILGIESREFLPEVGPLAHKSVAYRAVQKVTNFWKAVKGEIAGIRSTEIT
jgi:hypothetical protein